MVNADKFTDPHKPGEINQTFQSERYMVFNSKAVYFVAGEVFMLPKAEPANISVEIKNAHGFEVFSSLDNVNNKFTAKKETWNNLATDFATANFMGAKTILTSELTTAWGDGYTYLEFFWDEGNDEFFSPSFEGDSLGAAEEYLKLMEKLAEYFRLRIGKLPVHNTLVANSMPGHIAGLPKVNSRTNWIHFMQIWPESSAITQLTHHIIHQYSHHKWFTKLYYPNTCNFLEEGIPTLLEHTVPAELFDKEYYYGKLYSIFVIGERGKKYNIGNNEYHLLYNIPSLKSWLLDEYIKGKTAEEKDMLDFFAEMYKMAEKNSEPKSMTEAEILTAFENTAGKGAGEYFETVLKMNTFDSKDFEDYAPSFIEYVDRISNAYFWESKLLYLAYFDILSSKGGSWPHFANYENNMPAMRREGLEYFKTYLLNLNKAEFSEEDIEAALNAATGNDHSDFFEFWRNHGFAINAKELPPMSDWDYNKENKFNNKYIPRMMPKAIETIAEESITPEPSEEATMQEETKVAQKQFKINYTAITVISIILIFIVVIIVIIKKRGRV